MKITKGNAELVRIAAVVFLTIIIYQLVVVQLLGNKAYDLRVGRNVLLLTAKWQLLPVLLLSVFIVYFVGEYRYNYKRATRNLLILFCGLSVLLLCFLFAKHVHQLYTSTVHKFDGLPKGLGLPGTGDVQPTGHLVKVRNILLVIDGVLALCLVFLWYNWSEGKVKNNPN
jgi:hypothetical protein